MLYHRLSWGLLYAALVTTMSILMSIIATYTALFPNSDFFVIFFLIFLYGISSVSRAVMELLFKGSLHPNTRCLALQIVSASAQWKIFVCVAHGNEK